MHGLHRKLLGILLICLCTQNNEANTQETYSPPFKLNFGRSQEISATNKPRLEVNFDQSAPCHNRLICGLELEGDKMLRSQDNSSLAVPENQEFFSASPLRRRSANTAKLVSILKNPSVLHILLIALSSLPQLLSMGTGGLSNLLPLIVLAMLPVLAKQQSSDSTTLTDPNSSMTLTDLPLYVSLPLLSILLGNGPPTSSIAVSLPTLLIGRTFSSLRKLFRSVLPLGMLMTFSLVLTTSALPLLATIGVARVLTKMTPTMRSAITLLLTPLSQIQSFLRFSSSSLKTIPKLLTTPVIFSTGLLTGLALIFLMAPVMGLSTMTLPFATPLASIALRFMFPPLFRTLTSKVRKLPKPSTNTELSLSSSNSGKSFLKGVLSSVLRNFRKMTALSNLSYYALSSMSSIPRIYWSKLTSGVSFVKSTITSALNNMRSTFSAAPPVNNLGQSLSNLASELPGILHMTFLVLQPYLRHFIRVLTDWSSTKILPKLHTSSNLSSLVSRPTLKTSNFQQMKSRLSSIKTFILSTISKSSTALNKALSQFHVPSLSNFKIHPTCILSSIGSELKDSSILNYIQTISSRLKPGLPLMKGSPILNTVSNALSNVVILVYTFIDRGFSSLSSMKDRVPSAFSNMSHTFKNTVAKLPTPSQMHLTSLTALTKLFARMLIIIPVILPLLPIMATISAPLVMLLPLIFTNMLLTTVFSRLKAGIPSMSGTFLKSFGKPLKNSTSLLLSITNMGFPQLKSSLSSMKEHATSPFRLLSTAFKSLLSRLKSFSLQLSLPQLKSAFSSMNGIPSAFGNWPPRLQLFVSNMSASFGHTLDAVLSKLSTVTKSDLPQLKSAFSSLKSLPAALGNWPLKSPSLKFIVDMFARSRHPLNSAQSKLPSFPKLIFPQLKSALASIKKLTSSFGNWPPALKNAKFSTAFKMNLLPSMTSRLRSFTRMLVRVSAATPFLLLLLPIAQLIGLPLKKLRLPQMSLGIAPLLSNFAANLSRTLSKALPSLRSFQSGNGAHNKQSNTVTSALSLTELRRKLTPLVETMCYAVSQLRNTSPSLFLFLSLLITNLLVNLPDVVPLFLTYSPLLLLMTDSPLMSELGLAVAVISLVPQVTNLLYAKGPFSAIRNTLVLFSGISIAAVLSSNSSALKNNIMKVSLPNLSSRRKELGLNGLKEMVEATASAFVMSGSGYDFNEWNKR